MKMSKLAWRLHLIHAQKLAKTGSFIGAVKYLYDNTDRHSLIISRAVAERLRDMPDLKHPFPIASNF